MRNIGCGILQIMHRNTYADAKRVREYTWWRGKRSWVPLRGLAAANEVTGTFLTGLRTAVAPEIKKEVRIIENYGIRRNC